MSVNKCKTCKKPFTNNSKTKKLYCCYDCLKLYHRLIRITETARLTKTEQETRTRIIGEKQDETKKNHAK